MPSINTEVLEKLVRPNQPTREEWVELIEARRKLIKSHLDKFTLPTLGKLECMKSESGFCHEISFDGPTTVGNENFSLETQGIFHLQPLQAVKTVPNSGYRSYPSGPSVPNGSKVVWGLTRSGLWVLATIHFIGLPGYKERGREKAEIIEIQQANLPTIIGATEEEPQQIWEKLGEAIKRWARRREELYNQALNLARVVEIEELSVSLIPKEI
ncbi:MAG TPA: hypothetical protein VFA52_03195 [Candidatus Paceibacterota bacterium]|nr:hypothetical protein [Candidatus Paceibacterota bacterium]